MSSAELPDVVVEAGRHSVELLEDKSSAGTYVPAGGQPGGMAGLFPGNFDLVVEQHWGKVDSFRSWKVDQVEEEDTVPEGGVRSGPLRSCP